MKITNAMVYQLADRIFHYHFSDNDGLTNVHWRPGKGKIDWLDLMQALKDVGFAGVISIELEDVPGVSTARVATFNA
jgi:sugar phosphate isomerase/epimerase